MSKTARLTRFAFLAAAGLSPTAALAHIGAGYASGFVSGSMHPLSGLDHIFAMVAVGIVACHLGGRALWLLPCAFVLVMLFGAALASAGIDVPFVELAIALSIVVFGVVIALRVNLPAIAALAIVGLFGLFHGHAHGVEMLAESAAVAYAFGFAIATVLLHALGIALGLAAGHSGEECRSRLMRSTGGFISIAGVAILAGLL